MTSKLSHGTANEQDGSSLPVCCTHMSFLSVLSFHVGEMKGKKLIPCLTQWSFHNPASYLAVPSEPAHPIGPLILL